MILLKAKKQNNKSNLSIFKGVAYGICLAIIGTSIATLVLIGVGILIGIADIENLNKSLSSSYVFIFLDLLFSTIICILSGYVAAKKAKGNEMKAGYLVAGFSFTFLILFGGFRNLPSFYNLGALLTILLGPIFGAIIRYRNLNRDQ